MFIIKYGIFANNTCKNVTQKLNRFEELARRRGQFRDLFFGKLIRNETREKYIVNTSLRYAKHLSFDELLMTKGVLDHNFIYKQT